MSSPHAVPTRITRRQLRDANAAGVIPLYPFERPATPGEYLMTFTVDGVGTFQLFMKTAWRDGVMYDEPAERVLDSLMIAAVEAVTLSTVYDWSHRGVLVGKIETPETRAEQEGTKVDYCDRDRASKIRARTEVFMADFHQRTEAAKQENYCAFCQDTVPSPHTCPNRRRIA